jgi:hypothetical protein
LETASTAGVESRRASVLLAWDFAETPEGLAWHPLTGADAEWIWKNLLDPRLAFG